MAMTLTTTPAPRSKVTVVGAGNVGTLLAAEVARRGYADVLLMSGTPGLAAGRTLDIRQAGPILGRDLPLTAVESLEATSGSAVVVIATSARYEPGQSRGDQFAANRTRVQHVAQAIAATSPNAVIIVVTNPVEAMCAEAHISSAFDRRRVLGMAGVLDTARLQLFLSDALGVGPEDVRTTVIGGHGDSSVALLNQTTVKGIPIRSLLTAEEIMSLVRRAQSAGKEITELLGTETPSFAPAMAAAVMVETIVLDQHRVLPLVVRLEGELGFTNFYAGVCGRLGRHGLEEIVDSTLTSDEAVVLGDLRSNQQDLLA